jgi:SAM-dependent methyltransferase
LAARSDRVQGVDLSPIMIRIAKERSAEFDNLTFEIADALNWHWPRESFDGIVSIAALHHLPLKEIAERMKQALRPGGVLAILDVYREHNLADYLTAIAAIPVNLCFRLLSTGCSKAPREYREAWCEHQKTDRFLTLSEVREVCRSILPGSRVSRHLLWRYSLVWRAPKN